MADIDPLFELFVPESKDHLEQAEESLLRLERDPGDEDAIQACFCAVHSLKGNAAYFNLERVQAMAQAAEQLLDRLRTRAITAGEGEIEALLQAVSLLAAAIGGMEHGAADDAMLRSARADEAVATLLQLARADAAAAGADVATAPLDEFQAEAAELLARCEEHLLAAGPCRGERLREIFRAFHTLKGIACYLGHSEVEADAHAAESLLTDGPELVGELGDAERAELLALADRLRAAAVAARVAAPAGADHAEPTPAGDAGGAPATPAPAPPTAAVEVAGPRGAADGYSRVSIAKLEDLVNLVGELLIAQTMVLNDAGDDASPRLRAVLGRQTRIMRDLQSLALGLRMVPLKSTFRKMARAAHDTAQKLGKSVEFAMHGEDTEIDRAIADGLADPLLHMVRNAIDHGLEPREERLRAGKPATGQVTLSARQAGDNVVIEIADDGRGIDLDRIRQKAVARGLLAPEAQPSGQELEQLIFLPGFSTAAAVTGISGRGVGMDVVRRNVQALQGSVEIANRPGLGTTFTIRLPLTTAILDSMLVRVGTERYLVPISAVLQATRPLAGTVTQVLTGGRVVESRGELLPVVALRQLFALADADDEERIILVLDHQRGRYALEVDEILGQQQVVIKPLDEGMGRHPGLAGSAILPDGRVGLILDPERLVSGRGAA